jgi:hypothetical protein
LRTKMAKTWQRVAPMAILEMGQKGGMMVMAVAAKKHVTFFKRSRRAYGAGDPSIKAKFKAAAKKTKGVSSREDRNRIIAEAFGK